MTWQEKVREGLSEMLIEIHHENIVPHDSGHHLLNTPNRVVKMLEECLMGPTFSDAGSILAHGRFNNTRNISEMVHISGIQFVSYCAHHLVPIIGLAHFAYIPNNTVIGLSKVPRLIEALARRPQVQEELTDQIVSIFNKEIQPIGCGVIIDAQHMCMVARGVKSMGSWTRTTALTGKFFDAEVRAEFLSAVPDKVRGWQ